MSEESLEIGPIDYVLVEWKGRQPTGEAVPHLIDLVDRGIIRIIDLAFIAKGENSWAAPFASAVRRGGGQLVASGRIPVEDLLAALDAAEATA